MIINTDMTRCIVYSEARQTSGSESESSNEKTDTDSDTDPDGYKLSLSFLCTWRIRGAWKSMGKTAGGPQWMTS
jgi:hypothetical protein